jgi:hypothetical protein
MNLMPELSGGAVHIERKDSAKSAHLQDRQGIENLDILTRC